MLPHHILTAVSVLKIDLGHSLSRALPAVIGAGIFTGRIDSGKVEFTLETFVPAPTDPISSLLCWLNLALHEEHATITAYDVAEISSGLSALPDADVSPALRTLAGQGCQPVIDTVLRGADRAAIGFASAALSAGIPSSPADVSREFNAWMTGRQTVLIDRLETDVIASWRLAMNHIAERSSLGHRVNAAIERHLADWLGGHGSPAAALHLGSLARTAG